MRAASVHALAARARVCPRLRVSPCLPQARHFTTRTVTSIASQSTAAAASAAAAPTVAAKPIAGSNAAKLLARGHVKPLPLRSPSGPGNILPVWVVKHEFVKRALPLVGNAAYLALVGGFMMTDVLILRTTLICGYSGLVLFHLLHPQPLRIPLRWSCAFVLVNAIAAAKLAADRWPAAMSEEDEELYTRSFSQMTRGKAATSFEPHSHSRAKPVLYWHHLRQRRSHVLFDH